MENQIDIWISGAEEKWLKVLHKHAEDLFSTTFLPSHDHTHHQRVWHICRDLLTEIAGFNAHLDQNLVEGVLIAAYFHDLGMAGSPREDHGMLGRKKCETYFHKSPIPHPSILKEVLEAIEKHDVKEEKTNTVIHPGAPPGILDILSIADDLDALGIIGIYRYTEIYLKRNMNLGNLGIRVLGNVHARFKNISMSCKYCPKMIKSYRQPYSRVISFFDNYNQQLITVRHADEVFFGHLGVVNLIRTLSVEGDTRPEDILATIGENSPDTIVGDFFKTLHEKLNQSH